jgi:hypothetical protein
MNKRTYERINVLNDYIPVKVTKDGENFVIGTLNDISKIGISFYSHQQDLISKVGTHVYTSFFYKGKVFQFEMELLRETDSTNNSLVAGKFIGLPSLVRREILNLLITNEERELAYS